MVLRRLAHNFVYRNIGRLYGTGNLINHLRSATNPEKVLFHVPEEEKSYSKSQFWTLVDQYSNLLQQLGLTRGDRLVAQVNKSVPNTALYLATLQNGSIYVPLNTDYTHKELEYFIQNAEPKILVRHHDNFEPKSKVSIFSDTQLREMASETTPLPNIAPVDETDIACICYTSGTTGRPKGAKITHKNLSSNARALVKAWRMSSNDVLFHALPMYHVHGMQVALNTFLLSDATAYFVSKFDIDLALNFLPKSTVMMGVPTYYTRLLKSPQFTASLVKNMRLFVCGSAPLPANVWHEFKDRTGMEILERYGMTEGGMICSNPYEGPRKPGTVGKPLEGVQIRITNDQLEYKGSNLFAGYWRMSADSEFTSDGFFKSGDLAEIGPDGFVRILGRGKDLVISGGLNIYPKQIEDVLNDHPEVHESAVIGVPHADFGEALVAIVVPQGSLDLNGLSAFAKERLASFKVPKRMYRVEALPRNAMGKVSKVLLRDTYAREFVSKS